jgi:hypothetical protein
MILSIFLFVHATFARGYPIYHPVELFCIILRFVYSTAGLLASIVGKGKVRPHVAAISTLILLVWFANAMAQWEPVSTLVRNGAYQDQHLR